MGLIIPNFNYTDREKSVVEVLRNTAVPIRSFLNIGFHDWNDRRRHWWIEICNENNIKWHILEIFPKNVSDAISQGCPMERITNGSILDQEKINGYDCIMFWHGPEHIEKKTFTSYLPILERTTKLLILGMPLGEEKQSAVYGNRWEEHISSWEENDWTVLGYKTKCVFDKIPSHITVYKEIK